MVPGAGWTRAGTGTFPHALQTRPRVPRAPSPVSPSASSTSMAALCRQSQPNLQGLQALEVLQALQALHMQALHPPSSPLPTPLHPSPGHTKTRARHVSSFPILPAAACCTLTRRHLRAERAWTPLLLNVPHPPPVSHLPGALLRDGQSSALITQAVALIHPKVLISRVISRAWSRIFFSYLIPPSRRRHQPPVISKAPFGAHAALSSPRHPSPPSLTCSTDRSTASAPDHLEFRGGAKSEERVARADDTGAYLLACLEVEPGLGTNRPPF